MGVNIWVNRGKIYLDVYWKGQRCREALHLTIPEDPTEKKEVMRLANVAKSKREQQLFSGEWELLDHIGSRRPLYSYLEEMSKTRSSNDRVNRVLKYLKEYPGGIAIQLGQVSEKRIRNFQEYMEHDTGLAQASAASYSQAVRMALNQAVLENVIHRNPAEAVKVIPVPESDKVHLNTEEMQRLSNTPMNGLVGEQVKKAFLFACYCGLRISDLIRLEWGDIERDAKGMQIVKKMKKTQRKVYVPVHDTAWEILTNGDTVDIHPHGDRVFPLLKDKYNNYLVLWAKKAGIEKHIGWHTARHTFAVLSLENGADIYTVSKLLGHTDLKTTQVYAKMTNKMGREAVEGLPAISIKQDRGRA
ncbi:phage integrase family site specific recombinase [Spirochaetia bacterium]|nr:phage integrase family site specific recombinase [Spirochaetia bacterium]